MLIFRNVFKRGTAFVGWVSTWPPLGGYIAPARPPHPRRSALRNLNNLFDVKKYHIYIINERNNVNEVLSNAYNESL